MPAGPVTWTPGWENVDPERVSTHTPFALPINAVLPSPDNATESTGPYPVSVGPGSVQVEPERVNTDTAPALESPPNKESPTSAVAPSADNATLEPKKVPLVW
jgi:hypothetical protein